MAFSILGMQFGQPLALLSFIPVLIILLFIIKANFVKRLTKKEMKKDLVRKRLMVFASRSLVFLFLIIAMSGPFTTETVVKQGLSTVTILSDNSTSMEAVDTSRIPLLYENLRKEVPIEVRTFASGNTSPIGEAALAALSPNNNILLITDGNNNYGRSIGDAMISAKTSNSTINAVNLRDFVSDTSVRIEGNRLTTDAKETKLNIIVNQVGAEKPYQLQVFIDGVLELEQRNSGSQAFSIEKKFEQGNPFCNRQIDNR